MDKKEKVKTTVYLEQSEYRRLKEIARQQGSNAAEQIREAIAEYVVKRESRSLPESLGAGASGKKDLSERAEKLLRGFGRR